MSSEKQLFENQGFSQDDDPGGIELQDLSQKDATRQESVPQLFAAINAGNIDDVQRFLQHTTDHINSSSYGGLTPLHAACHMQQPEILKLLIVHGAKIDVLDSLGNSPLHVAASERWIVGIKELLDHGASINQMSNPPTNIAGVRKETPLHAAVRTGDISSVTLMLKHKPTLSIRDRNGHTVFHLAAVTRHDHILKQLLMDPESQQILEDLKNDTDSLYHAALLKDANVDNEQQVLKVMQLVYKYNEDMDVVNFHGETPIFLACQLGLPNAVKYLLDHGADPAKVTLRGQTTLHAACKAGCSTTLKYLLQIPEVKEMITVQDSEQRTPFHYAVISASVGCCKDLLDNGEHLTNVGCGGVSNCKFVMQKLPSAMRLFRELFDSSVKLSNNNRFHPDFSITFDYSVLMSSEREELQSSIASELCGTPLESLIKHPLLESFLFIKWNRLRKVILLNVFQYFLYVLVHTIFVALTYGVSEVQWKNHPEWYQAFKIAHIVLVISHAIPALIFGISNVRNIIFQWETYTWITAVVTSVTVIFVTTDILTDQKQGQDIWASISVLFVWVELMMLLGRFPALGTYILMFTKVSKSLIKFIASFLSLIIGFSLCFYVLFRKVRTNIFDSYSRSFSKTIMMMTGEIAYSEFFPLDDKKSGESVDYKFFFYLLMLDIFVFLVTVVTNNLLIGLAVNDIPQLNRLGKIRRLVKQAIYLMAYEKLLAFVYKRKFAPPGLREYLSSNSSIKSVVQFYPNKEKMHSKYFSSRIPEETLKEAIELQIFENEEDFQPTVGDEDISKQLKAFHMRYSNDRRTQKHKFEDLSVISGDIMKILNQTQSKVNKQMNDFNDEMDQMSRQVKDKLSENQTLLQRLLELTNHLEIEDGNK